MIDLPEDREERRKLLTERYGAPRRIHAGDPLRQLGIRDKVHPSDVVAFVYSSLEAYSVYSEANQRYNSFPSYGPLIISPTEVIGVLDYRQVLPLLTDPKCSDDTPSASSGPAGSLPRALPPKRRTPTTRSDSPPSVGVRRLTFDT